jgi:hypothetical protein
VRRQVIKDLPRISMAEPLGTEFDPPKVFLKESGDLPRISVAEPFRRRSFFR